MASALDELNARIAELRSDLGFVAIALQLRPRIGAAVQWQAEGEVLDLVKHFMNAKSSRPEGFYGPLLVRLLAAFERYLRLLVAQSVERRAIGVSKFEDLSEKLSQRNVSLTGRLLAAIDAPRDHLTVDIEGLISNLATCKRGSAPFRLNAQAFAAAVTGVSPIVIEKVLDYVDVPNCWDGVGGNTNLARILQTKGARATGESARDRLRELWRWRNHLAHGGDEEIALTELQLHEAINFVHSFSAALDTVVAKRINGT